MEVSSKLSISSMYLYTTFPHPCIKEMCVQHMQWSQGLRETCIVKNGLSDQMHEIINEALNALILLSSFASLSISFPHIHTCQLVYKRAAHIFVLLHIWIKGMHTSCDTVYMHECVPNDSIEFYFHSKCVSMLRLHDLCVQRSIY